MGSTVAITSTRVRSGACGRGATNTFMRRVSEFTTYPPNDPAEQNNLWMTNRTSLARAYADRVAVIRRQPGTSPSE